MKFKPGIKLNHNIFTKTAACFQEVDNYSTCVGRLKCTM